MYAEKLFKPFRMPMMEKKRDWLLWSNLMKRMIKYFLTFSCSPFLTFFMFNFPPILKLDYLKALYTHNDFKKWKNLSHNYANTIERRAWHSQNHQPDFQRFAIILRLMKYTHRGCCCWVTNYLHTALAKTCV